MKTLSEKIHLQGLMYPPSLEVKDVKEFIKQEENLITDVWTQFIKRVRKADWIKTNEQLMMCFQNEVINVIRGGRKELVGEDLI